METERKGQWIIGEGTASWHQMRAGGIFAAHITGFSCREDAAAHCRELQDRFPEREYTVYFLSAGGAK